MRRAVALLALVVATAGPSTASAQLPFSEPAPAARITFSANDEIYTIAHDGSDRRRLTTTAGDQSSGDPDWAPDRQSIAFVRGLDDGEIVLGSQIRVVRADGSGEQPYASASPRGSYDFSPAWSPTGDSIAFVRRRFQGDHYVSSLMVTGPGGAGARTVVRLRSTNGAFLDSPAWSPDGKMIVYSRIKTTEESFEPALYSVSAGGGTSRRLVANGDDAAWSPEGQRIAFTSLRDKNGQRCGREECSYAGELYVMNADGTNRVRITSDLGDERAPNWSADGRRIAFHSDRNYPAGEHPELYTINPDGSCLTWLTNGTARSMDPDWEPVAAATDPGSCAVVPREPLIETDTSAARRSKFPVYWLGPATDDGLMVSSVYAYGAEVFIEYDDCSRFDPADCVPPISLSSDWNCLRHVLFQAGYEPENVTRVGEGLLYDARGFEDTTELYAGPTSVAIYVDERPVAPVIAGLRRVNGESQPGQFPLAQLPSRFLRRIERAAAAQRKYGTAGAARRLKLSRGVLKERAAIHRRLRELGRVGRLDCSG